MRTIIIFPECKDLLFNFFKMKKYLFFSQRLYNTKDIIIKYFTEGVYSMHIIRHTYLNFKEILFNGIEPIKHF